MPQPKPIAIIVNYRRVTLDTRTVQYVFVDHNTAKFYLSTGARYKTRLPIKTLEPMLGDEFIRTHRNYFAQRRRRLLDRLSAASETHTESEYHDRFRSFDDLPIAFCDIEMVLDTSQNAVDWIFRCGNETLAKLEKTTLSALIGSSFSSVFPNIDEKWLKSYERTALYGQTLEIIDHSHEIDTDLDIICFPTIKGHCGCILLNVDEMHYAENQDDRQNARLRYLSKILSQVT